MNHSHLGSGNSGMELPHQIIQVQDDDLQYHDDFILDDTSKTAIVDVQKYWLHTYKESREKILVEMTEKLHQEFLSDQQKIRADLLTQFRDELDTTKMELEAQFREMSRSECAKVTDRHRREIANAKKKQWCVQCENEAIYHCCWNTAYCSVECQQGHWASHRKVCRRKKGGPVTGPAIAHHPHPPIHHH